MSVASPVVAGEDVSFSFVLGDGTTPVILTSEQTRVSGPNGVILDWTSGMITTTDNMVFSVLIPATWNTLNAGVTREARLIEMEINAGDAGILRASQDYIVRVDADELSLMVNSFQTYVSAIGCASLISDTPGWDNATADDRRVALMAAFSDMVRMQYDLNPGGDLRWARSRAGWGFCAASYFDLACCSADDFATLPISFRNKLIMAQVAEADSRLAALSDPARRLRESGVVSETIGENTTTFKSTPPIRWRLDRRTIAMLSPFMRLDMRLTRA